MAEVSERTGVRGVETRRESGAWKSKHDRILSAALDEFVHKGFNGASMDRIAHKAKVSKVTVYNHFENKDLLYRQMVEYFLTSVFAGLPSVDPRASSLRDVLIEYGSKVVEATSQPKTLGVIRLLRAASFQAGDNPERIEAKLLPDGSVLAAYFEHLTRAGAMRCSDPLIAARQFIGMLLECSVYPALLGRAVGLDSASVEATVASCTDAFLCCYQPS